MIIGGIESIRDITDIKKAELKLLKNYEELQTAYEEIHSADEELRIHVERMDQQEQELREKSDLLNMVTSHISGVIFRLVVNPEGFFGFTYINDRCMEILGIGNNPDKFSQQITDNIFPEDRERFLNSIQDAISRKNVWNFEGRYVKPSGEIILLKVVSNQKVESDTVIFNGIIIADSILE